MRDELLWMANIQPHEGVKNRIQLSQAQARPKVALK